MSEDRKDNAVPLQDIFNPRPDWPKFGFEVPKGVKNDQQKPRPSLLPMAELMEVVQVFEHGAEKYSADNWKNVERERYVDSVLRHAIALAGGQVIDPDSGLPHAAMISANGMIISWHDKQ